MNVVARKNVSIIIGVIAFLIILLSAMWLCTVVTDYIRYKTNAIPIFAYNVTISGENKAYKEMYEGIGYSYICYLDETPNEFYVLGIKVP